MDVNPRVKKVYVQKVENEIVTVEGRPEGQMVTFRPLMLCYPCRRRAAIPSAIAPRGTRIHSLGIDAFGAGVRVPVWGRKPGVGSGTPGHRE